MTNAWDWTTVFEPDIRPNFVLTPDTLAMSNRLPELSFEHGLRVIVTSVPHFENHNWNDFRRAVKYCHASQLCGAIWLAVVDAMRHLLSDVRQLLNNELERAVVLIEGLFEQQDTIEQCALMGCLYQRADNSLKARLILNHLRQRYDHRARQTEQMLRFYRSLTPRLRDVAQLVARGYSNQEIADTLVISKAAVAEYMTGIFRAFSAQLLIISDTQHGTRYRLIHHLTRLFEQHPELLLSARC